MRSEVGRNATIGVVGGGPAGAAVALRLARLGHSVILVTDGRTRFGLQGISRRTIEALTELGATAALQTVGPPTPRLVLWNGGESSPNDESLIHRGDLDRALLHDAAIVGTQIVYGTAHRSAPASGPLEVMLLDGQTVQIATSLWIEARGRSVLRPAEIEAAGPKTLAVQQHFHAPAGGARSGIVALEDAWCWVAVREDGYGVIQYTTCRRRGALAGLRSTDLPTALLNRYPTIRRLLSGTRPAGPVRAYPAGLALSRAEPPKLRAGDALLAPDLLSGHGLYEALSGSRYVAAAANTYLCSPDDTTLAHRFVRARARERYTVLAALSAHIHHQETRWGAHPFWAERRHTQEPIATAPTATGIVHGAAVFDRDRIVATDVLVTARYPRGVWRVHDVPVVDLLRRLRDGQSLEMAASAMGMPLHRTAHAAQWLEREGHRSDAGQ